MSTQPAYHMQPTMRGFAAAVCTATGTDRHGIYVNTFVARVMVFSALTLLVWQEEHPACKKIV